MENRMDHQRSQDDPGLLSAQERSFSTWLLSKKTRAVLQSNNKVLSPLKKRLWLGGLALLILIGGGALFILHRTPSGHLKWSFLTGSWIIASSPVVVDGTVYVGSSNGKVYALDAGSGRPKWSFQTTVYVPGNGIMSSIVVANNLIYVEGAGRLYALDRGTGRPKWSFPVATNLDCSPVVANGLVYVGAEDGKVYALDAFSGQPKWFFQTEGTITTSPVVVGGMVYIDLAGGELYALDALSGRQRWASYSIDHLYGSPVVANGTLYLVSFHGTLSVFDATSGRQKGSFHCRDCDNVQTSPILSNGTAYINSFHTLYAFDAATGQEQWSYQTGGIIFASPTAANGMIYLGSEDGNLYALDAVSGWLKWSYQAGRSVSASPTVVGEIVYISAGDRVEALQSPG